MESKRIFERLYQNYYSMVHQLCLGFVKNRHELAEDLTQETFINIWRSLPKFKGVSSHKTWIYRITVNTCLKYIRDNQKYKNQEYLDQMSKTNPGFDHNYDSAPDHLYRAIGRLKEVDRLIIMMLLDECTYDEIANVFGLSEVNLRVKIHRI
ncbi:MAG: RNA polymerase sigma factor, partial [Candidatus Cyclobacteriaceae bacterium M3_2C_046]